MRARDNPFASDRVLRVRYEIDPADWARLMTRGTTLHWRAALVGPPGSGKTTLREDLEARLATQWRIRRVQLSADRPPSRDDLRTALLPLGERELLSIDGAEQLGWLAWRRIRHASQPGGLIITSHRPGLLPTLHLHRTDAQLLTRIVTRLIGPPRATALSARCHALFHHHRGDLRACLRTLYDDFAAHGPPLPIPPIPPSQIALDKPMKFLGFRPYARA